MGDFLGFTFGGVHSSDLGITRVSGGDRYDEALHPEIKDRTAEVPGLNGEYYFGSDYGTKEFDIEFAFDSLTEAQFRTLRKVFGTKEIKQLVFDERPYKYYMAKIANPVELSYVCFNEPIKRKFSEVNNVGTLSPGTELPGSTLVELPDGVRMVDDGEGNRVREKVDPWVYQEGAERIYKGEGNITFVCYYPFAKSNFKVLPQAGNEYYEGSEEWVLSSGILSATDYARFDTYSNGEIKVYNPGDLSTGFRLYCPFSAAGSYNITLAYTEGGSVGVTATLQIQNLKPISNDIGFIINTDTGLIIGVSAAGYDSSGNRIFTTSGNLYNRYVTSGYFFKINPNILYEREQRRVEKLKNTLFAS